MAQAFHQESLRFSTSGSSSIDDDIGMQAFKKIVLRSFLRHDFRHLDPPLCPDPIVSARYRECKFEQGLLL